jgi:putative DNA methylase
VTARKKLIEVALPLEAINIASAREKSIRHGHPSTLHLWWARRPLAAARAVIFAQMVDDPSAHPDIFKTEKAQEKERQRLFKIIEELVKWENTTNEEVLQKARNEIWRSWRSTCAENADHPRASELFDRHKLPAFHDPFAGGGALPLEAQRLGLEAYASDLNPVAVLINKAMIEIPPRFAGRPPVNPEARRDQTLFQKTWHGAQGLAEDMRYYGKWMGGEAERRIGHLYPMVEITADMTTERPDLTPLVGRKLTVIAWLWARTVKSPNPAFANVDVPLASTYMLSTRAGTEAYVAPAVTESDYRFIVKLGMPKDAKGAKNGTKLARGANFQCLMSGAPIAGDYIKAEGKAGRMGCRMMAVVAEGQRARVYLSPTEEMEAIARQAKPEWKPDVEFFQQALGFRVGNYGMTRWSDLFTPRQLAVLTTLSDLIPEVRERVRHGAIDAGLHDDDKLFHVGGGGAAAYADALAVLMALAVDRVADRHTSIATWDSSPSKLQLRNTFARQAVPMTWDFGEGNPFCMSSGAWSPSVEWVAKAIAFLPTAPSGAAVQADASTQTLSNGRIVSTDPPYYDNVGYADLSDFFYVWLRRSLKLVFPELFATLAVPKAEELVATPGRHSSVEKAETFFLNGMTQAMHRLAAQAHPAFPVTIYYAFKQAESDIDAGTASTGWETFLNAVIKAGFATSGTWPIRTELGNRIRSMDSNALASSIVLVCRRRMVDAPTATRRDFVTALKTELPRALAHLQRSNIAPVDLAQAAIGPGMAVYTRYTSVIDAAGRSLTVREALSLINEALDELLTAQEGDCDADSRFALTWFEQWGFAEAEYGLAETLATARNTSVSGMKEAGILASRGGTVRLLAPNELPADWDPTADSRLTAWEIVHHMIRALETGGEGAAATLAIRLGTKVGIARDLAYRLYTLCERKKRAPEALSYNALVQSWPEITRLAREGGGPRPAQAAMFESDEQ